MSLTYYYVMAFTVKLYYNIAFGVIDVALSGDLVEYINALGPYVTSINGCQLMPSRSDK